MSIALPPSFREIVPEDMARPDVTGFECGTEEWDTEVADVLASGSALSWHNPRKGWLSLLYCRGPIENQEVLGFTQVVLGRKIGFPDYQGPKMPCLHIANIALASRFQGQGLFRPMMRDIIQSAIDKDLKGIDLLVHQGNTHAIAFYERLDFIWHPDAPLYPPDTPKYRRMFLPLA